MDVGSDALLQDLRRGEREAFVRYYDLYRARVYGFMRRLLHDDDAAASGTEEAFVVAYRQILLHGEGDDLPAMTFLAAVQVCDARLDERDTGHGASPDLALTAGRPERSELGRRFGQALDTLQFRHHAVLLLHDMEGLRAAGLAIVFGMTVDAAGALLFRAGEEFRRAFDELSSHRRAAACRLAELTAAGAVGRILSDDETRRLHEHAAYCRQCRRTMKGWGGRDLGLALFLEDVPLPQALERTPVFGTAATIVGASGGLAVSGAYAGSLTRIRRGLTSKAAAYALAAACLALSVGFALHHAPGTTTFVVLPASGPNIAGLTHRATRPLAGGSRTGTASGRVATRAPVRVGERAASSSPAAGPSVIRPSAAPAAKPVVTIVADAGVSSQRQAVATPSDARSTEAPQATTPAGDAKAAPSGPSGSEHSSSANGHHAQPAKTRSHQAKKPTKAHPARRTRPATKTHKDKPTKAHKDKPAKDKSSKTDHKGS
jgi:DNA-directed RNA polymerase specialized sigma24 family protein